MTLKWWKNVTLLEWQWLERLWGQICWVRTVITAVYLGSIKIHEFGWAYFCKKSLVDLIVALWSLAGGWFLCFVIAFFLSCINLDWFFNRDPQQINKVDWICHRKQHFGPKLARPRNRLFCHFIPPLSTPSPPSGMRFFLSIVHPFLLFRLLFLSSFRIVYFLSFLFSLPSRSRRYGSSCQTLS